MKRWLGITILAMFAQGWDNASAQSRGAIELGLDGGVGMAIIENATFIAVGFPAQGLRIGWFAGDRIEIEPSVGYYRYSSREDPEYQFFTGDREEEVGTADLALSFHLGEAENAGRAFVKGGGLVLFTEDASQFGPEVGLGWKHRFDESHWALRIELAVGRTFDSDELEGAWLPSLTFGFSHFSR
jgi:hypothetical protein